MPKGRKKGSTYTKHSAYDKNRIIERFLSKTKYVPETGCLEWQGGTSYEGYGGFYCCWSGKGKTYPAHRFSYIIHISDVPDEVMILHKCNNKLCVHPDHLYAGTHQDNMNDLRNAGTLAGANNPNHGIQCSEEKRRKLKESNTRAWENPCTRQKYLQSFKRRRDVQCSGC